MIEEGAILHIENYNFGNEKSKNKFLIVLLKTEEQTIVTSLTTSKQYISDQHIKEGCIHEGLRHAFFFRKNNKICSNDFSFRKNTFILFDQNIREIAISIFQQKQKLFECCGILNKCIYEELIYCAYKSNKINRRVKRLLESKLNDICK